MEVRVEFLGLRSPRRRARVRLPAGSSVQNLLEELADRYVGEFAGRRLRAVLNGRGVTDPYRELHEGDEVLLFYPVGGG